MNLVRTAVLVKKIFVVFVLLVVLYITFLIVKAPIKLAYKALFPPKDQPTLAFGLLDPLNFTEVPTLSGTSQYVLNTKTGKLPFDLPDKMKVYKYIPPKFSFSEGENAQKDAKTLGFSDTTRVSGLSANIYVWQDLVFGGTLKIDTQTKALELNTPLSAGDLFPAGLLTPTNAINKSKELLRSLRRFNDSQYTSDTDGFQKISFGKFGPEGVIEADSLSEAQIARVDFFRKVGDYKVLPPDPTQGLLQVFLRAPGTEDEHPQLNYPKVRAYEWLLTPSPSATYPLIPVSAAWQQVQEGKGVIVSVIPQGASPFASVPGQRLEKIIINDVYLAYYDDIQPQRYLQPIYVFQGNYTAIGGTVGNIFIYYPAISGEYVKESTQK